MTIRSSGCNKSKILVFGSTGYFGKHVVRASVSFGHPTFVFAQPATPQMPPSNLCLRDEFRSLGVTNVQRFLPSEFGCEEDRITLLPPFEAFLETKKKIRRLIEASAIPYTFVSANCFAAYFINLLLHPHDPRPDLVVYGTGEAKAVLNYEQDTTRYTIKVANDPRTCNRVVSRNVVSQNELISLWEKKMVQSFEKVLMQEDEMIKLSQTLPSPDNIAVSIIHSIFVKGDLMSFDLDEDDLEATSLYPEIEYTTVDQLLDISSLNLLSLYPLHWNEELYLSTRLIAVTECTNDGSRDFVLQIFL